MADIVDINNYVPDNTPDAVYDTPDTARFDRPSTGPLPINPGTPTPTVPEIPSTGPLPINPGTPTPTVPERPSTGPLPINPGTPTPTVPERPGRPRPPVNPETPTPTVPERPQPGPLPLPTPNTNYATIRFLNAAANNLSLSISINNRVFTPQLGFGDITSYGRVTDGFRTVTITNSVGPRVLLYRKTIPFLAGEKAVMVVTIGNNGVEVVKVLEQSCINLQRNMGCMRVSNMSHENSSYDVIWNTGDLVFKNVGFKETTVFKQARTGSYDFYLVNAERRNRRPEISVIGIENPHSQSEIVNPVLSFRVDVRAGSQYTAYIIGNTWSASTLRVVIIES